MPEVGPVRAKPWQRWSLWLLWFSLVAIAAWQADLPALLSGRHARSGVSSAHAGAGRAAPGRTLAAQAALPPVEPVEYLPVSPELARTTNAAIPFAKVPNPPARPFVLPVSGDERARALACLTSAAYYEAGNDPMGQRAVIQVVLNRVRHPAFPHNICGVVFEGANRPTGCQFTFACDGALARRPDPVVWDRARALADLALSGAIFSPVGNATHYHADYVVPKWATEMDKIAQVHLHLFYLWRGFWGTFRAFRSSYAGPEQLDPRIATLVEAQPKPDATEAETPAAGPAADAAVAATSGPSPSPSPAPAITDGSGNVVRLFDATSGQYVVQLNPAAFPGSYALFAYSLCRNRTPCQVAGWRSPADLPRMLPLGGNWRATVSFFYDKRGSGNQTSRWNCAETPRDNKDQCLPTP